MDGRAVSSVRLGTILRVCDVDHVAGRRIRVLPVEAEGDPAGLVADARCSSRSFGGMTVASKTWTRWLRASHHPDFLLIGRQADAMARAAVPFDRPCWNPALRRDAASCPV